MITRALLIAVCLVFALSSTVLAAESSDRFLDIKEVQTDTGARTWLVEDHTLPIIAIRFTFLGAGSIHDPEEKQGLSYLLSTMLDEGAGEYDSQAFQKLLNDHSISLGYSAGRDDFSGSLKTLTKYKDLAFELLALSLKEPRFDEEPFQRMKASSLTRIRSSMTDPSWIASRLLNDIAYKGHPYALNSGGTISSLETITIPDLKDALNRFSLDTLVISAVGDITEDELKDKINQLFSHLPKSTSHPEVESIKIRGGGKTYLYEKDIPQTIIKIGQPGIDRHSPDYYTAQILNFILGGSGFGSRLTETLREERGLTYGVYTGLSMMTYNDSLFLTTQTKNESAAEVLKLIKTEWEHIINEPVSEKELENAKSYLIGALPLTLTSTDKIASLIHGLNTDKMSVNYLDNRKEKLMNVSREDIQSLAKQLLTPESLTTILIGKPTEITPTDKIETLPNVY
jgi:zinc protease